MNFFKSSDYYNRVKISAKDARGMLVSIDLQLEEMLRHANMTFDEYIESVGIVKNISEQLSSITTDIENDQTDEKHFVRAGGELQRSAMTSMSNLKKYVDLADKQCSKYFDICDRINNLMFFRNTIISKCKTEQTIAKPQVEVESNCGAK